MSTIFLEFQFIRSLALIVTLSFLSNTVTVQVYFRSFRTIQENNDFNTVGSIANYLRQFLL